MEACTNTTAVCSHSLVACTNMEVARTQGASMEAARNTRAADSDIRAARNTEAETARTQGESSSSNHQTFFAP